MDINELRHRFLILVSPDLPNEWDVEEAMEPLEHLPEDALAAILAQVPVIWPISNSLCYSYLNLAAAALDCIAVDLLSQWVNEILDQYERSGLKAAQRFMFDVQNQFVCRLQGRSGLRFSEVVGRLLPYGRGLTNRNIELDQAECAATDTATIFLPAEIAVFPKESDNFLLYKLTVSFQWSFIALGTFLVCREQGQSNPSENSRLWLQEHFAGFSNSQLIADVYHGLETLRAKAFLEHELPGLMRDVAPMLDRLGVTGGQDKGGSLIAVLQQQILGQSPDPENRWSEKLCRLNKTRATALDNLELAERLYADIQTDEHESLSVPPLLFQGQMQLDKVGAALIQKRRELKKLFIEGLATLLVTLPEPGRQDKDKEDGKENNGSGQAAPPDDPSALVIQGRRHESEPEEGADQKRTTYFITIDNQKVELSEDLAGLADDITCDLGQIPDQYISSAAGKAGQGSAGSARVENPDGPELFAPITYDEWDYRRGGFRRNWCIVTEKEIPITRSTFIRNTLDSYHGQIIRLRHQFEMMRTSERFVRRQRDGDDIDLDALVESLADSVAGHPPSDRLFIRLKRDERDIAALFLVDMSNSTRGWVGKAIKEALVLICEAMESLGDRYGIYGFSGMRRLRCEIFPIKNIDQAYTDEVRERIGSIDPREYTRMAPAIRHMTSILADVDANVRLLITLSDGKPEDYDDYKGEYAIEDTRHALIEAKMAGIHPFCITIDQHAHEYMAHMYGEVNYIFLNDVRKLPIRMPEIYRVLTS